jgi:hypothetical protein
MLLSAPLEKRKHYFTWRWIGVIMLFFICVSAYSQNTKGDKPARPLPRITQKSKPQKGKKIKSDTRDISGRRLRTKNKSTAARAVISARSPYEGRPSRVGDRPAKPIKGASKRIRSSSAKLARNNVYPNKGIYINNPSQKPRKSERSFPNAGSIGSPWPIPRSKGASIPRKNRVAPRSASRSFVSRGRKNVYWGKFSKGEKPYTKDIAGGPLRTKNFRTPPIGLISQRSPYGGRKRIGDKPAARGRFPSSISSRRNGRAWMGDISGKRIGNTSSKKRMENAGVSVFPREQISISGSRRLNRPIRGSGFRTKTGRGIFNRAIPNRAPAGGANVGTYSGNLKRAKGSGFGEQGVGFSGSLKSKRQAKGGGSISGRPRNNRNNPIGAKIPLTGGGIAKFQGRTKRTGANYSEQGIGFSGFLKAKRQAKGGGSISGQARNNRGSPIDTKVPASGGNIGRFQGNFKSKRLEKGGGSISGQARNNGGNSILSRTPSAQSAGVGKYRGKLKVNSIFSLRDQGEGFTGFLKSKKPVKGGGSITGRARNNRGNPLPTVTPSSHSAKAGRYSGHLKVAKIFTFRDQGEGFTGYIKAKKPVKGGGSVSSKLWNNKGKPIDVRTPLRDDAKAANYSGKIKTKQDYVQNEKSAKASLKKKRPNNVFLPEGLQVKVKTDDYRQHPLAAKSSLKKLEPKKGAYATEGLQVKVKAGDYRQNPLSAKNSLKKHEPKKGAFAPEGLQVKVKRGNYQKNPNSKEGALKGIGPESSSVRASEYVGRMRVLWDYKHNPSSSKDALKAISPKSAFARGNEFQGRMRLTKNYRHTLKGDKDALKVIAPGKAYAKIGNYQGNLKMKKLHGKNLHPDAKFAHGHGNNVKKERTFLTSAKLWWSKLFKKNDTQPTAVKEKVRRPRYDKSERDLWKDLYD